MFQNFDSPVESKPFRVAIIGGGPGGLMTCYRLQQYCKTPVAITIYEADARLGGKICTEAFKHAPVSYEAGAAELYDYSHAGEDPLRELIDSLGLEVTPMQGTAVIIEDRILTSTDDIGRVYGEDAMHAVMDFDEKAREWMDPEEFYDPDRGEANADLEGRTFYDELALVPNEDARRYLRIMVHSDLATEPHRTSASYGLQNYLMNDPDYLTLYTITGGIERLPRELAAHIQATVLLKETVSRVERVTGDALRVVSLKGGEKRSELYDYVVVCLPNVYLTSIEWAGDTLAAAMHRHHIHHDYPAHYLRVSVLFREPFWKSYLDDTFFMLDAFGGCCLYDESSRNGCQGFGVLGWLLAGDAALDAANHTDPELIEMMLASLPSFLQHGRERFVEGQVHRWVGAVNGMPGGSPVWNLEARHVPDPTQPNLLIVGDYLFDSTLNGVLDSADYVADRLSDAIATAARANAPAHAVSAGS